MEIHQILVSASPGDAVTNTAFGFQELLQKVGPSAVFARYIDPSLDGKVFPLPVYEACSHSDNLLIYQASIGEPEVTEFLLRRDERIALVYHNITPPEYFATLDPSFAQLLAGGRREIALLRDRVITALAVSRYNATELESLGYTNVRVSPLALDLETLVLENPDPETESALATIEGPKVLFVGQLMPHKRPDLLIQAFHVLTRYLRPGAHLFLVGAGRLEPYRRALQAVSVELGLDIHIPGWVTRTQLASYYRAADCFVTLSEHEGVCVPLLEAMAFEVPVLARSCAAIPETAGDAAVLLPRESGPVLIAEALEALLSDVALRNVLVERGRARVEELRSEAAEETFLQNLLAVA